MKKIKIPISTFIFLAILFVSPLGHAQSKKEQIVELNEKTDSIQKANSLQSEIYKDSIFSLKESLKIANQRITNLDKEIYQLRQIQKTTQKSLDSIKTNMATSKTLRLNTSIQYTGNYQYDSQIEEGPSGSLNIYADGKGNNYFTIDYVKGAPSYNMGTLSGIIRIYKNVGVFTAILQNDEESDSGSLDVDEDVCIIEFHFDEYGVNINQRSTDSDCWFGGNVNVGAYYNKSNSENKSQDFTGFFQSTDNWEIQD
jgi:hypothetical protein